MAFGFFEIATLVCAVLAGAGFALYVLAARSYAQAKRGFAEKLAAAESERAAAQSGLDAAQQSLSQKSVEAAVAQTQMRAAQARAEELAEKFDALSARKEETDRLFSAQKRETELMKESLAQTEKRYEELRKRLDDDFQVLASRIFDSAREKFAAVGAEKMSAVVEPLSQSILDFKKRVESIHEAHLRSSAGVSVQIDNLLKMNARLSEEADKLSTALRTNNKVAGNWGETVLERIFESCGFVKGVHYRAQVNFADSTAQQTRLMPDFIVDLPDNRSIIVDSKLSLVDYVEYCAAADGDAKRKCLEKFKKSVRAHLNEFAKKYDSLPVAGFKLMFMPVEPAYNLAVESDKTLLADAYKDNVLIVSPVSVMAILKYAQIAYRSEAFAKNMGELSKQGRLLCERIERFSKRFAAIQTRIEALQKEYDETKTSLSDGTQSVASTARRFHELSVKSLESRPKSIQEDTPDGQ